MSPAMVAPAPSDAPVGQQKKGMAERSAALPFARASKWHIEQGGGSAGIVLGATSAPQVFNYALPSYGYLSAVLITVVASGGSGVAAVGYEDAPWSALQQVMLQDTNGVPIFLLSGYHSFLAAKFGGYRLFGPDLSAFAFSAVANTGNFKFILPIHLEFGRDGLGCLPNMDASARYNLQLIVASGAASSTGPIYTTQPTGYPTLAITVEVLCRAQPPATDLFGNVNTITPPAVGTVQYWSFQTASGLANGANTVQLSRVGNLIRNHLLVFRNTNGTRTTAESGGDVPVLFQFDWDAGVRYQCNVASLRFLSFMSYGYDSPSGTIFLPNILDPDKIAVGEYGDEWMPTVGATKLTLRFTTTAGNGTLTVLTNDIVPASGQIYAAPALQEGY